MQTSIHLTPFGTPIVLFIYVFFLKPTEISEFTSHRRCLEARHAMLGEAIALVEELSALRDVRPSPVICHLKPNRLVICYVSNDRNS